MNEIREDIGYKRGMPKMKIPPRKIRIRYTVGPGAIPEAVEDATYLVRDTPEIRELMCKGNVVEVGT